MSYFVKDHIEFNYNNFVVLCYKILGLMNYKDNNKIHMRRIINAFFPIILLISICQAYQLLQQVPITFSIAGNISYTPTSGGANIPGYIVKLGFYKFSWVAIKFMKLTSRNTYDILVVKRQVTTTGGYYKTTVGDYFVASGRQNKLISDGINNMDKQTEAYTDNNYFQVQIYRTKGDTQGEDWEGGQFVQICFLTSSVVFDQNNWNGLSQSCYGYDVSEDYISTFRGKFILPMVVDGVVSEVYGGIQGPLLRLELFWYCLKPTLSSSDIYIHFKQKISQEIGYDFHKCNSGDYFGLSYGSLTPDTLWSGYDDGQCSITSSMVGTKLSYKRSVYTGDQFDAKIYNQTEICIKVGAYEDCKALSLSFLFPVMDVQSALIIFEQNLVSKTIISILLMVIMAIHY